jgi:hypothetical protein
MTLEQRAGECFAILSRATHMPKAGAEALKATAQFHIEAVRLLQTFEGLSECYSSQGGHRPRIWDVRDSAEQLPICPFVPDVPMI